MYMYMQNVTFDHQDEQFLHRTNMYITKIGETCIFPPVFKPHTYKLYMF